MTSPVASFYDLKPLDSKKQPFGFDNLRGKVVLVVNVASKCGFTPQYEGLEKLYEKYQDQGLEVLGFPCNQFGGQEPGTADEIQDFCTLNYGIKFPILDKVEVNGTGASPVYEYLKGQKSGFLGLKLIKWNYGKRSLRVSHNFRATISNVVAEKFLVSRDGKVVGRYASTTKPASLIPEIEKELAKEGPKAGPAKEGAKAEL